MQYANILKRFSGFLAVYLSMLILSLSCERAGPVMPENGLQPVFSSIQSNIFNLKCARSGCHLGNAPPQGLNLSEGNAFGNLVNVSSREVPSLFRVQPGNPDNSYIIWKLEGNPNIQGERMPRGGAPPLSEEEINTIREWIAAGAQNN